MTLPFHPTPNEDEDFSLYDGRYTLNVERQKKAAAILPATPSTAGHVTGGGTDTTNR